MADNNIQNIVIDELLATDAGKKIRQVFETVSAAQQGLYTLVTNNDSAKLDLLKIGTVFQLFFIDILASGKQPKDLTKEDWLSIADKVNKYAILEEEQTYSQFVFTTYANYIDISVEVLRGNTSEKNLTSIKELSDAIRDNTNRLMSEEIDEVSYIDACLWISLEAMMKLLCCYFTRNISEEYSYLILSVSQLAFEYGRYVLYSKEQAILDQYIRNQQALDEQLQEEYEKYLKEVQIQADAFHKLIDDAFSPDISEALHNSAQLARAAGVKESEILNSVEDVDAFFLD